MGLIRVILPRRPGSSSLVRSASRSAAALRLGSELKISSRILKYFEEINKSGQTLRILVDGDIELLGPLGLWQAHLLRRVLATLIAFEGLVGRVALVQRRAECFSGPIAWMLELRPW